MERHATEGHGTADPTVQLEWGVQSREKLLECGLANLEWKQYAGMGHSTCPQEMKDVGEWLVARLPAL
jgi:predicted esterase